MKKILFTFMVIAMLFCLCACGKAQTDEPQSGISTNQADDPQSGTSTNQTDPPQSGISTNQTDPQNAQGSQTQCTTPHEGSGLTNLTTTNYAYCNTEEGYYYISDNSVKLKGGNWGTHIMYMDFATRQEVYLCSDTGCSHDDESCNAVLSGDEFVMFSSRIFVWNDQLYLLSKDYDNEGSVVMDMMTGQAVQAEVKPAVLYQMNPDGTNRKKVYTFADGVTLEDTILSNDDNLYFVTKKLETNMDGNASVTTAQNRNLVRLNPLSGSFETMMSLDMGDGISWQIVGGFDNSLVLKGISYVDGDSGSADMSQEEWVELYNKSKTVYATLELSSKRLSEVYQIQNTNIHSSATKDGMLYVSDQTSQDILAVDLRSGKTRALTGLRQNNIMGVFSDMLVCRTWDMSDDETLYFVSTGNGEISHCTLTNQFNAWPLELICEAGDDALVIYDYKADAHPDGSYEIHQYKYALIAKEDLYAGINTFRPIEMIGKGR